MTTTPTAAMVQDYIDRHSHPSRSPLGEYMIGDYDIDDAMTAALSDRLGHSMIPTGSKSEYACWYFDADELSPECRGDADADECGDEA